MSLQIEVLTKSGHICGRKQFIDGKQLNVYLGIPYAQPPLNHLRFKKPIPVEPWNETLNAINWPNPCHQKEVLKTFLNKNMSEDCLYINVFAPKVQPNTSIPVMMWIHGGGFDIDTATSLGTIPTLLASRGNVIVVGINYRLNSLGFLYAANDHAPGNAGLYDQIMAMEWVNDNIEFFGGDKNRITIFGQSAGGGAVNIHMLSPLSRHLFNNAILFSTVILGHQFIENINTSYISWIKGAETVGCGNGTVFTDEVIECLRNLNPQKLVKMKKMPFAIYGDDLIPENPYTMMKNENFKNEMSVFIGFTVEERVNILSQNPIFKSEYDLTFQEANEVMDFLMNNLNSLIPVDSNEVSKLYFTGINHNDSNGLKRAISLAYGDFIYICPDLKFSELIANRQNRVYQYYLTERPTDLSLSVFDCFDWTNDACHRSDLIYWFGNPFIFPDNFTDNDRKISEIAMNSLSHFAHYGTLPPQNGIKWSNYFKINDQIVAPYYEFPSLENPDGRFGMNIKYPECAFWDPYINY